MRKDLALVATLAVTAQLACATVRTAQTRGGENVKTETLMPVPASRSLEGNGAVLLSVEFKGLDMS